MKSCLCCAYFTLLMVSIISSCLLFLLVASESTKIRQNLENKNENLVNNHENDNSNNVYDYNKNNLNENSDNNIKKIESDSSDNSDLNKNNVVFLESLSKNSGITENELPEIPAPVHVTLVDNPQQIIENAIEDNLENVLKPQSHNFSIRKLNEIPAIPEIGSTTNEKVILNNRIVVQEELVDEEDLFNDSGGEINDSAAVIVETSIPVDDANGTEEHPIPVFSEWAQKHMEEAEKLEKQESVSNLSTIKKNATVKQPNVKLRAKNYASPDCGAKIIASNPEAQSTSSVLSTSKDEYMLNPCQSRIWFVVELCEPIRAEKIELANFELFSSSPKQFSIGVTNRYPTRDWSIVGQFTAKDERDIQKFKLHPHLFGKFIKVEIHSHYSSEHFCPVSLFSVYGTSEFEAFATENEPITNSPDEEFINDDDEDDDDKLFMANNNLDKVNADNDRKDNPNILKSASDAVMSIVKKAAEVLTPKSNENNPSILNNYTRATESHYIGYTPNYEIACRGCSTKLIIKIRNILEFNYYSLLKMLNSKTIYNALTKTNICSNFINSSTTLNYKSYVTGILSIQYVSALCNILFNGNLTELNHNIIIDNRNENNEHNTSEIVYNNLTLNDKTTIDVNDADKNMIPDITAENLFPDDNVIDGINMNSQTIDPTKTLDNYYESTIEAPPTMQTSTESGEYGSIGQNAVAEPEIEDTKNADAIVDIRTKPIDSVPEPNELPMPSQNEEYSSFNTAEPGEINGNIIQDTTTTTSPPVTPQSDSGNIELNVDNNVVSQNGNQAVAPSANQKAQSESVFLRLSTRIKALERNLSLSEQYLEELSRRYKKQVEELQQSFSKVLLTIEDQNRRNTERETVLLEQNARLREDMDELNEKINSRTNFYIIGFIIFEIFLICVIRSCGRNRRIETHIENKINEKELDQVSNSRRTFLKLFKRRKSLENLYKYQKQPQITRRLSEEALQTYGTYNDLLISNGTGDDDCVQIIDSRDEINSDKIEKKKNKARNRKNSSQKIRANSAEPTNGIKNPRIKLYRHESAPGKAITINGEYDRNEYMNNIEVNDSILLEENDEFYMPNMDLALNEFMPDGPSFRQQQTNNNSNNNTSSASSTSIHTQNTNDSSNVIVKPIKFRRLSSPGFLKTALGRNSTKKSSSLSPSSNHEQTTGWEWYKLSRKSNNSSTSTTSSSADQKNHKKSKTDLHLKTSNSGNNGFNSSNAALVANNNDNSANSSNNNKSKNKSGNFRKLFKKVF